MALAFIAGLALIALHWRSMLSVRDSLQRCTDHSVEAWKQAGESAAREAKANAERLETSLRELSGAVRNLMEVWAALHNQIKSRARLYESATQLAERQTGAVEFLEKLVKSMRSPEPWPQRMTDEHAAEIESRITAEDTSALTRAAAGLETDWEE
jgi:hypothetical protein